MTDSSDYRPAPGFRPVLDLSLRRLSTDNVIIMIRRMPKHTYFTVSAVAVLVGSASFGLGSTQAATEPSANILQLIKQLGSDTPADRDAAEAQLEQLGDSAADALSTAARSDSDPEVRSRAGTALAGIKERDTLLASLVTVHAKDQPLQEVLNTIGACANCELSDGGPLMHNHAARSKRVTIDAVNQPFWDTLTDLCAQLDYCPFFSDSASRTLRLFPASRNWMTQSPHAVVGPYLFTVAGISRTRSIDLLGPAVTRDQLSLQIHLFPEPKLSVLDMSHFVVTEATDENGNSLVPPLIERPQTSNSPRDAQELNFMAEAKLSYPSHAGTKITSLSGNLGVVLGEDVQQCQVDNVTSTPAMPHPIGLGHAEATVTQLGSVDYQVEIRLKRPDLNHDQWYIVENNKIDLTLEDAEGRSLPGRVAKTVIRPAVNPADASGVITAQFFTGNPAHPSGQHTGKPTRLKLNIPKSIRMITIPVIIKDIPIP